MGSLLSLALSLAAPRCLRSTAYEALLLHPALLAALSAADGEAAYYNPLTILPGKGLPLLGLRTRGCLLGALGLLHKPGAAARLHKPPCNSMHLCCSVGVAHEGASRPPHHLAGMTQAAPRSNIARSRSLYGTITLRTAHEFLSSLFGLLLAGVSEDELEQSEVDTGDSVAMLEQVRMCPGCNQEGHFSFLSRTYPNSQARTLI